MRAAPEADGLPFVSLYGREWIDREASLDRHLGSTPQREDGAVFNLRYLRPDVEAPPSPRADWEVEFAREVLLTARTPRRADILRAAAPVVERRVRVEDRRVQSALADLDIDWAEGWSGEGPRWRSTSTSGAPTSPRRVRAGGHRGGHQPEGRGAPPAERGHRERQPWLDRRSSSLDASGPARSVVPPAGRAPAGTARWRPCFRFRDPQGQTVAESSALVETVGAALPTFSYTVRLLDDGSGGSQGDGDGLPEPGEVIELEIAVTNTGEGPAGDAYARIRNRAGRALDLRHGGLRLGTWRDADTSRASRVRGLLAVAPARGDRSGRVTFEVRAAPNGDAEAGRSSPVGDNERFDYATVQRGFYDYFSSARRLPCPRRRPSRSTSGPRRGSRSRGIRGSAPGRPTRW